MGADIVRIGKLLLMGLSIYSSIEANTQIKIENQSNIFDVDILKQHTEVDGINNLLLANAGMCVVSPEEINKYYLQKTMKTEINNKEKLEKDIVRLSSKKADVPKEDIKSIFIKRTSDMYVREIRNQVLQILNYNDNKTSGDKQSVSLLANCNGAMKKYNPDKNEQSRIAFNKSLDNTVIALEEERGYEKYLNNLKINNKKVL